ncbi:MAG: 23S rRNA (uracil(1939)-C(5))-methyltransferase RlmD, partial [Lachnospira sp.]|nr:23S rRNA (uracil(1939)-C(5))-methyltransferase RlmD [Lachnospira sp.]
MKKGETYTGRVMYADFPNKAVVIVESENPEDNGQKVIVKNSIPGQKIKFLVNKKRGGKCEGRLLEVLENSPAETNERCTHFGVCGGCVYQSVAYEEQLKLKEEQVKKILSEVTDGDFGFEGIIGSPVQEEYRNKMEFSFGDEVKGGELALGLHKRNSMYDIVTVGGCRIVDEDYRKILTCVCDYCKEKNLPYYHKMTHEGYLRHLLVRKAVKTQQILVDIVTTTQQQSDMQELAERLKKLSLKGELTGFLHTVNDSVADVVKNEGTTVIFGRDYIEEELLGLKFKITAFSFFQTNSLGAEVLYSKARDYVGTTKDKVVFDLYSGTGTIAQILAPVAKKVIGVEIIEEAVEAARINAELNGLENCEFITDDV